MNIAPPRAIRLAGLLLAALCVLASAAAARGPEQTYLASAPSTLTSTSATCPCNVGLPVAQAAFVPSPQCPCNAGLPDGPTGAGLAGVTTGSRDAFSPAVAAHHAALARAAANQPGGTFDWSAAGVGAGLMAVIGLLLAGGAWRLGRHRPRAQLPMA